MKTQRLTLTMASLALLVTAAANAGPYAGIDYQATSMAYRGSWNGSEPQHFDGYAIRLGDRFTRYFGIEASAESGADNVGEDHFAMRTAALDGIVYYPILRGLSDGWSMFGMVGAAYSQAQDRNIVVTRIVTIDAKTQKQIVTRNVVLTPHYSAAETDWRAGGGVECQVTSGIAIRFALRYQPASFSGRLSSAESASIGFNISL